MAPHERSGPKSFKVRVLRQVEPGAPNYWELFLIPYEPGRNITNVLQKIAAHPVTTANREVAPVAYAVNGQAVCPRNIPLMTSWARAGRATTVYALKRLFDG